MGRPPLTQEEKRDKTLLLMRATQAVMLRDGVGAVTLRQVTRDAGMSSAILYRYFRDLDELILFACVDLLKTYSYDLAKSEKTLKAASPEKIYLMSWELFCAYAFRYPECLWHLFFGKHSDRLIPVIRAYYELYPELRTEMSDYDLFPGLRAEMPDSLQAMMRGSRQQQRNLEILRPLLQGRVSEERLLMINDLTVAYFQMLLTEKINGGERVDSRRQTERMLAVCRFLIDVS